MTCAAGSPSNCAVSTVPVSGYSAGNVIRISNGLQVFMSTEPNSCPAGWKIWSPRSKADWVAVHNAHDKKRGNYPQNPYIIVDVTRDANGCPGCNNYAMNSGVAEQSSWKTSDGSNWWLRDSKFESPSGNYQANCYLRVIGVDPDNVRFNDNGCDFSSSDYLCQPTGNMCVHI